MKKIISLFQRNYDGDKLVRDEIVPGAEWVVEGEGVATRKWDGTSCLVRGGRLYKRYDAKHGKVPPLGFEPAQDPDQVTGHWPGWVHVGIGPEDKWHREVSLAGLSDGTYELIGPKLQGNPESVSEHSLIRHGADQIAPPRDFVGIRDYLRTANIEGIVWHHPDGRMVKIKTRDFGLVRK
jgi:hypothetical protein